MREVEKMIDNMESTISSTILRQLDITLDEIAELNRLTEVWGHEQSYYRIYYSWLFGVACAFDYMRVYGLQILLDDDHFEKILTEYNESGADAGDNAGFAEAIEGIEKAFDNYRELYARKCFMRGIDAANRMLAKSFGAGADLYTAAESGEPEDPE